MNHTSRWHRWRAAVRVAALMGLSITALTDCPMPFLTPLRQRIDVLVAAQAEIGVFVAGVEIPDGGATDAFSPAVQAQPMDVVFTVRNTGIGNLIFRAESPVELSGADVALFSVLTQPSTATVAPQASAEFTVRFLMDSPGTKTAKINLYSNDADESPYEINVSNTALPEIQVLHGTQDVASGTGSCDFGTAVYGAYRDEVFTIKNLGQANLDLIGSLPVSMSGSVFSVLSQPSTPIAPGGRASFTVRFLANWLAASTETLTLSNSDSDEATYTFTLTAAALLPITQNRIAGTTSTIARKADGSVWGWGYNAQGQLGDGTTTTRDIGVKLVGLTGAAAVRTGPFSLAIKSDGTLWAWGDNSTGQLGNGDMPNDKLTPAQVPGVSGFSSIAVGTAASHAVALKADGRVWTWGYNGSGQLGDGTTGTRDTPAQVAGVQSIVGIASGASHTVALRSDGTVWTWGDNEYGQLGDNNAPQDRWTPGIVPGLTDVIAVSAGTFHTVALKKDGTVWAWGYNNAGQLGDNDIGNNKKIPVPAAGLTGIKAIAGGGTHTVALETDGTVWAWGDNADGQLGDNDRPNDKGIPVQVSTLADIAEIAAGGNNTLAVGTNGVLWTWGSNTYEQLGIDDTTVDYRTTPGTAYGLVGVVGIASTGGNLSGTCYVLKSDGTVWAWGSGYGVTPVQVTGWTDVAAIATGGRLAVLKTDGTVWEGNPLAPVAGLTGVASIAAGSAHVAARKTDGTLWTWGDNSQGQLGNNDMPNDSAVPVQVSNWTDVTQIAAGENHTMAIRSDGSLWIWGDNSRGQLGNSSKPTDSGVPVRVSNWTDVAAVAGGGYHTVARRFDGAAHSLWAWGMNYSGQLGTGTTGGLDETAPVDISFSANAFLDVGTNFSLTMRNDGGALWCWGDNEYGQLGNGSMPTDSGLHGGVDMTSVGYPISSFVAVGSHAMVMKADGVVWTWGNNWTYQLGDPGAGTARGVPGRVVSSFTLN